MGRGETGQHGGDPGPGRRVYASLSGSARFTDVLRHGRRFRRGGITLIAKQRGEGSARVGLVVGRRVGRAVVRNRVKRRLRAALQEVGLPEATDYVVIGTTAVIGAPFRTLCRWLREAVTAIGTGKEVR